MIDLAVAALLAVGLAGQPVQPLLRVDAHLTTHGHDQALVFTISNPSTEKMAFDQASSPCAPYELVTVVFVGGGGIGRFVERLPLIADMGTREVEIPPLGTYNCKFYVSRWFQGRIPNDRQAILLWSFKPRSPGVFERALYGGAVLLQHGNGKP